MPAKLQPVRGTHDILPEENTRRHVLTGLLADSCTLYGYGEITTPIFEFSDVFHRTLGESSDVVSKETYTFEDRGGESLTLRPEFTASVVRALISNSLQEKLPFKVYYNGAAFRYERPQKGRLRQFHQFGAELLGIADPLADIEMIAMAHHCLSALGLNNCTTLELNSLGDADSRKSYRAALVDYFNGHKSALSDDSKKRLEKNPLRILDSKNEGDKKLIIDAPQACDYFTPLAKDFFAEVEDALGALNIDYKINSRLVRGLDYYSHTVFEFTTDKLGSQGTVLAGGRYDGLVAMMGGHDIAGVGFAAGIERLLALMEAVGSDKFPQKAKSFAVIPVGEEEKREALLLTQKLRHDGFIVELITRGNIGKKMKRAEKAGAVAVLIIGENELQSGNVVVKTLSDGKQQQLGRDALKPLLETLSQI